MVHDLCSLVTQRPEMTPRSEALVYKLQGTIAHEKTASEVLVAAEARVDELLSEQVQALKMLQQKRQEVKATQMRTEDLRECLVKVDLALSQEVQQASTRTAEYQAIESDLQGILVHQVRGVASCNAVVCQYIFHVPLVSFCGGI